MSTSRSTTSRAVEIAEQDGDARRGGATTRLVVGLRQRRARRVAELLHELFARLVEQARVEGARLALGVEERGEILLIEGMGGTSIPRSGNAFSGLVVYGAREQVAMGRRGHGRRSWRSAPGARSRPCGIAVAGTSAPSRCPALGDAALARTECPPGTAPDNEACVHLTRGADDGPLAPALPNAHREKSGRWAQYEQIPRLPDRPSDYDAYRYPIPPGLPGGHYVVSGYDLDRPDAESAPRPHALARRSRRRRPPADEGHAGEERSRSSTRRATPRSSTRGRSSARPS